MSAAASDLDKRGGDEGTSLQKLVVKKDKEKGQETLYFRIRFMK